QDPKDPHGFFAQFAVDDNFFASYRPDVDIVAYDKPQVETGVPEGNDPKLEAYFQDQTGVVVGQKLMKIKGWKVGQTITLSGTIYPGDWPMTIRAVYASRKKSFSDETPFFHFNYLDHKAMAAQKAVAISLPH